MRGFNLIFRLFNLIMTLPGLGHFENLHVINPKIELCSKITCKNSLW